MNVILLLVGGLPLFSTLFRPQPFPLMVSHSHPGGLLKPEFNLLFLFITSPGREKVAATGVGADAFDASMQRLFAFSPHDSSCLFMAFASSGVPLDAKDMLKLEIENCSLALLLTSVNT